MAVKHSPANAAVRVRIFTEAIKTLMDHLCEAAERSIFPDIGISGEEEPEDRQRNIGCRSSGETKKGRAVGRPNLGRPRATKKHRSF